MAEHFAGGLSRWVHKQQRESGDSAPKFHGAAMHPTFRYSPVLALVLALIPSIGLADEIALDKARDAIVARQMKLQNVVVHFDSDVVDTPNVEKEEALLNSIPGRHGVTVEQSAQSFTESFYALGGKTRFKRQMNPLTVRELKARNKAGIRSETLIYALDRTETTGTQLTEERPIGGIINAPQADRPEWATMDVALALRAYRSTKHLDSIAWRTMDAKMIAGAKVAMTTSDAFMFHTWIFDPKSDFALVSYRAANKDGIPMLEITCSDFHPINGVRFPFVVQRSSKNSMKELGEIGAIRQTISIAVRDCLIGAPENKEDLYRMVWFKGALIFDTRTNVKFRVTSERTMEDAAIDELRNTGQAR